MRGTVDHQAIRASLQDAVQHHQAGQLGEAETIYQQILSSAPNHPDALHLLGMVAHQRGQHDVAVEWIRRAVTVNPSVPMYHGNLGNALKSLGRLDEAIESYRRALELKPDFADAIGNLGTCLQAQSKFEEAVACYQKALSLNPEYLEARYNLGTALKEQGDAAAAKECFYAVLKAKPGFWQASYHLAGLLFGEGKTDEASVYYRQVIACNPGLVDAYLGFGALLQQQGDYPQALQLYEQLLSHHPNCAEGYCNRGTVLMHIGQLEGAVESYLLALQLNDKLGAAHYNLANTFQLQGKLSAAVASYRNALAIRPEWEDAHNNLGNVLQAQGALNEAESHFKQALSINPASAEAHNNLANVYKHQANLDAAIAGYRRALDINPGYFDAHSNLLFALSSHSGCSPDGYLQEARKFGSKALQMARPYAHSNADHVGDRMRIGLISGDLKAHPVGYFLESVLGHLDRSRIELVAYSTKRQEDDLTGRIKKHFSAWRPIVGLSDSEVARKIYQDGIDILIDLAGHTAHNRLSIFAWKPAPVQASWLGYFASTGVPGIDYILADPISVPDAHRGHFSERVWHLPDTRLCFSPPDTELSVAPLPALRHGHITFGCCQALSKLGDEVLQAWGHIFADLPDAQLRLQNKQLACATEKEKLARRLEKYGIEARRVTLLASVTREEYLRGYSEIDIALDTFPYPGGTTTCEALWMGVPTVTLAGGTMLARQGASLLSAAGLSAWVANSADEYVGKALAFSQDLDRLSNIHADLRNQVGTSPLFDAARFARNLEAAWQGMWHAWRAQSNH